MKPRRNPPCHTERSPNDTGELHYKSSVEGATKNQDAGKSKVLLQVQQNIRNALATETLLHVQQESMLETGYGLFRSCWARR